MNKRTIIFALMLLMITSVFSQGKLDAYKYIITSKQFDFQKSEDSYEINSLTKFLFEKQGFVVLYNNEAFPADLRENPCLGATIKLINNSTMFKTKVMIELKDCYNQLVLQTSEGESREKDYKKGFHEAVRSAFEAIENERYSFSQKPILKERQEIAPKVVVAAILNPVEKEVGVTQEIIIEKPITIEPKYQEKIPVIAEKVPVKPVVSIEGFFQSDTQTLSIKKQGNQFIVSDEKQNVVGIVYPTSQATYFILKWLQSDDNLPKLVFLNEAGAIVIDEKEGVKLFKRSK